MNLESELTWIEVKQIADEIARQKTGKHLSDIEMIVLQGAWGGKTYEEMAQQAGYTADYLNKDVGNKLWKKLSDILGEKVSKKNLREPLKRASKAQQQQQEVAVESVKEIPYFEGSSQTIDKKAESPDLSSAKQELSPLYPSGSVPLGSPFYLERTPIEEQVNQEIRKPGALIRIKAPREMGKTSMLVRILDYAKRLDYRTVSLNLEQVDQAILSDLNQFLRWLCANTARQLRLKPKLDEYWDEDLGSKISCTSYFQDYLLESIDTPFVLALDEVNQIFEHPQVAKDFLPLLRSWYEEAKTLPIWQKLRLLVVHSTEIYVPLQLNQSPFNVGLPIQLDSFSQEEVQQLAQRYGLDWADGEQARQLMAMVGGHPSLGYRTNPFFKFFIPNIRRFNF